MTGVSKKTLAWVFAAAVLSGCVGTDHAQAYCTDKGLKKGTDEFRTCEQERHKYSDSLFRPHRATP